MSPETFNSWEPVFLSAQSVSEEELEGYKLWKQANGGASRKRRSFLNVAFIYQRPALPRTFACRTIGPAGLNFRHFRGV